MQQTKDSKEKARVFQLARLLGVESKALIDVCKRLGFDVKSQLAGLEPEQVEAIKQEYSRGAKPAAAETVKPAAVPLVGRDKRIKNLAVKPRNESEVTPRTEPLANDTEPAPTPHDLPLAAEQPPLAAAAELAESTPPVAGPGEAITRVETPAQILEPVHEATAPQPGVELRANRDEKPVEQQPPVTEPSAAQHHPTPPAEVAVAPREPNAETKPTPALKPDSTPPIVMPKLPNLSSGRLPTLSPVASGRPPTLDSRRQPQSTAKVQPPAAEHSKTATPTNPTTPPTVPGAPTNPGKPSPAARPDTPKPDSHQRPPAGGGHAPARHQAPGGKPAGSGQPGSTQVRPGAPGPRPAGGQHGGGQHRPGPLGPRHGNQHGGGQQRPGSQGPRPAGGQGGSTGGQGGAGGQGDRTRRPMTDRKPGAPVPPAARLNPQEKDKKITPAPAVKKFTAEQLKDLRDGRSVTEVLKKTTAIPENQAPNKPINDEEEQDERKRNSPGKIAGRDSRHADRAKRQEQRKVRQKDVVIQGGHVDVIEETHGSKRGRRASLLKKKTRLPGTIERKGKVPIGLPITVRSLSEAIGTKKTELLLKLKDLTNSLYTINSTIEIEVAELIATEKGVELEILKPKDAEEDLFEEHKQAGDDESKFELRAPVVTIMGHVDHGKTSLLDKIRQTNIVASEAGGITQVIRAWRVFHNGKPITFLDTPGHEAFTKMRARGANVTDIVVIVVAVNDGVMPQTEEAINHAKAAGVSIVVALNKVDLPDANIRKTEQQLYTLGLLPDSMGGDCQFVQTSAAKGTGINELLETLSLVAEVKELKANPHKPASGTCLEAYLSGDEGVMATLLIQQGTLHRGDVVLCGASYGRVRAMYDDQSRPLDSAGPSVPVRITGLDDVPNADDHFHVVTELAQAREIANKRKTRIQESHFKPREAIKLEKLGESRTAIAELKVILKAEARGSIEAIRKELEKLVHEEVRVRLLHTAIGAITESDVQLALASPNDSIVIGFNVVPDENAIKLADERGITIREYNIIYKLTEDVKSSLEGKLKPREDVIHLGRAVIRETFRISRVGTVAGCYVTQGTLERSAKIRVIREGAVVYPPPEKVASLESLKRFKDDAREVREGYDCGLKIAGYDDVKVGDVIEAYRIELVQRTL